MMKFQCDDLDVLVRQRLEGHTGKVWSLAWKPTYESHDSNVLASGSEDNTVRIWKNPSTDEFQCKEILKGVHTGPIVSVAWSPCGELLATASSDATAAIWKEIGGVFAFVDTLKGHIGAVNSVSWDTNSTSVATCGRDKKIMIWLRDVSNKFHCIKVLEDHTEEVKMVMWHPELNLLFSCSCDKTIKVWEQVGLSWKCVQTLDESVSGHTSAVRAFSFDFKESRDQMVSCSDDLTIKIWKCGTDTTERGEKIRRPWTHLCTISGDHDQTIFSVHWQSEGIITTGAADGDIFLFGKNENRDRVQQKDDPIGVPRYVMLLRLEKAHDMHVNAVQWTDWYSMERRLLASSGDEDGTIKLWKVCASTQISCGHCMLITCDDCRRTPFSMF